MHFVGVDSLSAKSQACAWDSKFSKGYELQNCKSIAKSQFNKAKCMCVHSTQKMSDLQVTMWSSSSDGSSLNPDTNFQFLVRKSKETCMHVQTPAL
jgi:hypothetical protein